MNAEARKFKKQLKRLGLEVGYTKSQHLCVLRNGVRLISFSLTPADPHGCICAAKRDLRRLYNIDI